MIKIEKWLKEFLQDKENQEYIKNNNWEKLYDKLSYLMNTGKIQNEDAWQLTSVLHDSGIYILYDPKLTFLPSHMFYGCQDPQFTVIEIPNNIISIGVEAFSMSESIKKVILPKNLKEIYIYAFAYSNIEEVHYPGTEEEFYENVVINDTIFEESEKLKICYSDGKEVLAQNLKY